MHIKVDQPRKKKLSILKKRQRLNQILPKLISQLVELEPDLKGAEIIELEEIEEFLNRLRINNQETVVIKRGTKTNPAIIYELIKKLSDKIDQHNYFSTNQLLELWYASVNTKLIVENFEKVIKIDGDFLVIHDKDLKNGLWIDMNEEYWIAENNTNYELIYELKVWGEQWTKQLLK